MKSLYLFVGICLLAAWGLLWSDEIVFLLPATLGVGLFFLGLHRRNELWVQAGFAVLVLTAAFSAVDGERELTLLTSICACLAAWDISAYLLLLQRVHVLPEWKMTRRRVVRLGGAIITGWGFGAAALTINLELGFGVILLLSFLVVLGLAFSILFLRRHDGSML